MSEQHKPKTKIVVSRHAPLQEVQDDGHAWAVSYADFLMVLLSFFIIFFSINENDRDNLIQTIAVEAASGSGRGPSSDLPGKGEDGGKSEKFSHRQLPSGVTALADGIDGFFVEHQDKSQKLYIYFNDNLYGPGEIELPEAYVQRINNILTRLKPFMKDINITFVGHTDNNVVVKTKNRFIANNFDLSSLRATKALQVAVKLGFDPTRMFSKGAADHIKGSRTISLVITPNEEGR